MYSYHIWGTWYNGSYTMMAKPIRALELHYPMIQFLVIANIPRISALGKERRSTLGERLNKLVEKS